MSEIDIQELIVNSDLAYVVYAINKSTRDNLVTVLDASFTDKEVLMLVMLYGRLVVWNYLVNALVVTTLLSVPDVMPYVVTYMLP